MKLGRHKKNAKPRANGKARAKKAVKGKKKAGGLALRRMKLASKMSLILGAALVVIFAVLIAAISALSERAISTAVADELRATSKANGAQVQEIFNTADFVIREITAHVETTFAEQGIPAELTEAEALQSPYISAVYSRPIPKSTYDAETFFLSAARSAANTSQDITGVGVMFERNSFYKGFTDYAVYIAKGEFGREVKPYGSYNLYAGQRFYSNAVESGQVAVTEPYESKGIRMVTVSAPILYNGAAVGVVRVDIAVTNFSKINAESERYPSMGADIFDERGTIIYDSSSLDVVGGHISRFITEPGEMEQAEQAMAASEPFSMRTIGSSGKPVMRFFDPVRAGDEQWWSMTVVSTEDISASTTGTVTIVLCISLAALAAILAITLIVLRRMLKPIGTVVQAAGQIAQGNLDVQITVQSEDEIGMLAQSFQSMSDILQFIITDVAYLMGEMANGNFAVFSKAGDRYMGDFFAVLDSIRKLKFTLSDTLAQINVAADQVSAGAEQVSSGAQALSQGATEQAGSIEALAATIADISEQTKKNAEGAAYANTRSEETSAEMLESNRKMEEMMDAMTEISKTSEEIGKIIKTIEDIAFQTNILALNAAVEAARAGEAGKGFAVVADEVRNLASKSAEAAQNTTVLIQSSLRAVQDGGRITQDTAKSLLAAVAGARAVTDGMAQISQASSAQSASVQQVTEGMHQIAAVVHTNSATAEESAAASEELSGQSQLLKDLVGRFRLAEETGGAGAVPSAAGLVSMPADADSKY